jgi:hypothetical protein
MFELFTIVDITETGARRGDPKLLEHQQQNYLTVMNTIGLRANPTIIKAPYLVDVTQPFAKEYKSAKKVWRMVFDIEYGAHSIDMLKIDFNLVPFIKELTEDANIIETAFRTEDDKSNIIFKEIDK